MINAANDQTRQTPTEIRLQIRARRRNLTRQQQRRHSRLVTRHFLGSIYFRRCHRVAIYLAADGEIDPLLLCYLLRKTGKQIYLPVIHPVKKNRLWFAAYQKNTPLIPNRFGIDEPDIRRSPPTPPWGLDLIILPLVAYDGCGTRLGMGGGFYDRALSHLKRRNLWRKPKLLGLAHQCQKIEKLPKRDWDIPLDAILTEQGIEQFSAH